jgi:hypothetical protein
MSGKREWDLTSTHSLESAAEWMRVKAGALCVIVIRRDDSVLACDPQLMAADAKGLVYDYMPALSENLERSRLEKRKAARLELGAISE